MPHKSRTSARNLSYWLWLTVMLCLLFGVSNASRAGNRILASDWLEDPTHALSIVDLPSQTFRPFVMPLARGYTASTTWVRLRIAPETGNTEKLIVRVQPPYIDEIALYDPTYSGVKALYSGDHYGFTDNAYPAMALNFAIPPGDGPRDIYLRLRTTSTSLMYAEVLPLIETVGHDRRYELAITIFQMLIALSLLWALLAWLATRDRLTGVFVLKQAIVFCWGAMLMGLGRTTLGDWMTPASIDALTSLIVISLVPSSLAFDVMLLREFHAPRWGVRVLYVGFAVSALNLVLLLTGYTQLALRLNATTGALCVPLGFLLFCLVPKRRPNDDAPLPLPKALPVFTYGLALLLNSSSLAAHLGVLGSDGQGYASLLQSTVVLFGNQIQSFVSGVLMVVLLYLRSRKQMRYHDHVRTQLRVAEESARQDRAHAKDQERLLAMLAHELKTPLSVIRVRVAMLPWEVEPAMSIKSSVAEISSIVDRCLEIGMMTDRRYQRAIAQVDLAAELRRIVTNTGKSACFVIEAPESAVIHTDLGLLRGIVGNLLQNAQKYSPPDSSVEVKLYAENGHWLLTVANLPGDAGWPEPGKVFSKYYRSSGAHRQSGSGLGLYLVQAMSAAIDASISYRPTDTHIRFILCLPISAPT